MYCVVLQEKEFVIILGDDCRYRHYHSRFKREIVEFAVQIEILLQDFWRPIVRYDTAHGFAHRDFIHANGFIEKTPLMFIDYNSALIFAEQDLRLNWQLYREQFLKEVKSND